MLSKSVTVSVSCLCLSVSVCLNVCLSLSLLPSSLSLCMLLAFSPSFSQEKCSNGCNNVYIYVTVIKCKENYDRYYSKSEEQELEV